MEVTQDFVPAGTGIRTGYTLTQCKGLVIHWIGVAQGRASVIRRNFESSQYGTQYVIDWYDGSIIQCTPEMEVCYHVGSDTYTDLKEQLVGSRNPNWYFAGIECCISPDSQITADYGTAGLHMNLGEPSPVQYEALVEFCADFLTRHGLTADNLYRHHDITGKMCHIWFLKEEERWYNFKNTVTAKMKGGDEMSQEELEAVITTTVNQILAEKATLEEQESQSVSLWAKDSWGKAVEEGIFDGTYPRGDLTREQCAVVLDRLGLLKDPE